MNGWQRLYVATSRYRNLSVAFEFCFWMMADRSGIDDSGLDSTTKHRETPQPQRSSTEHDILLVERRPSGLRMQLQNASKYLNIFILHLGQPTWSSCLGITMSTHLCRRAETTSHILRQKRSGHEGATFGDQRSRCYFQAFERNDCRTHLPQVDPLSENLLCFWARPTLKLGETHSTWNMVIIVLELDSHNELHKYMDPST